MFSYDVLRSVAARGFHNMEIHELIVPKAWPSVAPRLPLGEGGFPN